MGLFNFTNNVPSQPEGDEAKQDNAPAKLPVVIQLNEEAITISAEDAEGKSIQQLFQEFGDEMGDVNRINRFIAAGQIVSPDDSVVLGTVYRGAVTSEHKGIA